MAAAVRAGAGGPPRGAFCEDDGYVSSRGSAAAASTSTLAVRQWCYSRYGASDSIYAGRLGGTIENVKTCPLSNPAVDETTVVWWRGTCEPGSDMGSPGRISTAGATLVYLRDGVTQTLVGTDTPDFAPRSFLVAAAGGRVIALTGEQFTFASSRTGKGVRKVPALPGVSALALGPLGTVAALTGTRPECLGLSVLTLQDAAWRTLPGCFTKLASTFGGGKVIVGERGPDGVHRLSDLDPASGDRHQLAAFPARSEIEGVAAGGGLAAVTARGCTSSVVLTFSLRNGGRALSPECPVRLRTRVLRLSNKRQARLAFTCPHGCPDVRVVVRDARGRRVGASESVYEDGSASPITLRRVITRGQVHATWRNLAGDRRTLRAKVTLSRAR